MPSQAVIKYLEKYPPITEWGFDMPERKGQSEAFESLSKEDKIWILRNEGTPEATIRMIFED